MIFLGRESDLLSLLHGKRLNAGRARDGAGFILIPPSLGFSLPQYPCRSAASEYNLRGEIKKKAYECVCLRADFARVCVCASVENGAGRVSDVLRHG